MSKTPKTAMEEIFSEDSVFQSWMDFEAALARAEASMGIVPQEAANEITDKASIEFFDKGKFKEIRRRVWLPTVAFIQTLQSASKGLPVSIYTWEQPVRI